MTMNYMSQSPRTKINAMSMRYVKDRIDDEDELKLKMLQQQQTLEDTAGTKKTDDDITRVQKIQIYLLRDGGTILLYHTYCTQGWNKLLV